MERVFIGELKPGNRLAGTYSMQGLKLNKTKNGDMYLRMDLADKSGKIVANFWRASQKMFQSLVDANFVRAEGMVETYNQNLQVNLTKLDRVADDAVDLEDFIPHGEADMQAIEKRFTAHVNGIANEHLGRLVRAFTADPEWMRKFRRAPAAASMHHAYLGGLMEHVTTMLDLADAIAPIYPRLSKDKLKAAIVLHDIGKMEELDARVAINYTTAGNLVGHITLGSILISETAGKIENFPQPLLYEMIHLVLSHHGMHEFGSPKLPMTIEAVALHYIDNLDAKLNAGIHAIEKETADNVEWTSKQFIFENRQLYRGVGLD